MEKQRFDLNDDAQKKIHEQYDYADAQTASSVHTPRSRNRTKSQKAPAANKKQMSYPDSDKNVQTGQIERLRRGFREISRQQPAPSAPSGKNVQRTGTNRSPRRQPAQNAPAVDTAAPAAETFRHKLLRHYKKFAVVIIILGIIYIALNIAFLYFRGQLWFNEPRARDYPVRGAVVDSSLGEIDWKEFRYQPIKFAYIRATKGTKYVDEQFEANRAGIDESPLWAGYYHEFDFTADGKEQAEHYIAAVGSLYGDLRPVVKLTAYGIYNVSMKDPKLVKKQLHAYLKRIKEEYGRRAVVMCDNKCYKKYIEPYFSEQTLWIIDHYSEPDEETDWALWEYNPRVRAEGYSNKKEYFCMTVYRGGKDLRNFRKNLEIGYEN